MGLALVRYYLQCLKIKSIPMISHRFTIYHAETKLAGGFLFMSFSPHDAITSQISSYIIIIYYLLY